MTIRAWTAALVVMAAAGIACSPARPRTEAAAPSGAPLRVAVSPASPPMAFDRGGELAGVEIDLAMQLGAALGRPVRFVQLPWSGLVPALLDGRADVIMSNMSVTRAREFRIAFADPYLRSGLVAAMRRGEESQYPSVERVLATSARVGAIEGTTGERFARDRLRGATVSLYPTMRDAVLELEQNRIDLLVHDLPVVGWYVSENEGDLALLPARLTEENIAWGFRPGDEALRGAANAALARWRADGTLGATLRRWLRLWPEPL
jgi:ABC-type amino acid transport substrate-binding protein